MKIIWSGQGALARRFLLGVVPVSLAGILLLGVSAYYYTKRHITHSVNKELAAFSSGAAAGVSTFFRQRESDIETLSETSLLADYYNNVDYGLSEEAGQYRRELERYFGNFSKRARVYNRVYFANPAGRTVCGVESSVPLPAGGHTAARQLVKQLASGGARGTLVSPVSWDPRYGPVIIYARPVYDDLKKFRGAVVLEAGLRPLQYLLANLRVGYNSQAYITDLADAPVLAWRDDYRGAPAAAGDFTARESIPGTDLRVMLVAPMSDFKAPLTSISRVTIFLGFFFGVLVWLVIYFTIKGMTRPLEKLVLATRALAEGREFERVDLAGRDEIGVLAESFNSMGVQLTERTRELESRIKELLFLQRMSAGVIENLEEEHICRVCLEAAVSGLGFDRGVLYLVDAEKRMILGRYVHATEKEGFDEAKMRARAVPLDGDDILAEVVRKRAPINVKAPGGLPGVNMRFIEETGTKAFCLVPLMTEKKVLGVIAADNCRSGSPITDEQVRNLTLFGNFTALALENAGLVSSVKLSEARYRTVLDNSPDAILGLDENLRVNVWNLGAGALFGYDAEEITGKLVSRLFDPLAFEVILRKLRETGYYGDTCVPGLDADGKKLELDVTWAGSGKTPGGNKKEWTVVIRDTSEQRSLHSQLIQAEKLTAVGKLISSVAHELNNPLGAIVGYADILYKSRKNGLVVAPAEDLAAIYEGSVRCGKIIKNLLLFVRETRKKKQAVSPEEVVRSSLELMAYKLTKTENIRVVTRLAGLVPPIMADYHQIEQILVNLVQNACDALAQNAGEKTITIETMHRGTSVHITVADNGPGIPQDILPRVFDPFFTTKDEGQGTGLGLPICRRIAEDHGGAITCESAPGSGTVFTLELPIVSAPADAAEDAGGVHSPAPGKKVLVVDDEAAMQIMLKRMLEASGQLVDTAGSGAEGLALLAKGRYDLVICDVEMGAVKGFSVREELLRSGSDAGFIFTTGNLLNAQLLAKLKESGVPFLGKPFNVDELHSAMNDALG
ncbi:MAG: ATP-binding protein [Elusimicrobiales bacterium]|nr:ATP-binding protein [Elusimicrobiales bacterium]